MQSNGNELLSFPGWEYLVIIMKKSKLAKFLKSLYNAALISSLFFIAM
jgi:hypothetical protein